MVSDWWSVIAVSLNVSSGVRLIKLAKLYMSTQTHYKHNENGDTVAMVPYCWATRGMLLRELDYTHFCCWNMRSFCTAETHYILTAKMVVFFIHCVWTGKVLVTNFIVSFKQLGLDLLLSDFNHVTTAIFIFSYIHLITPQTGHRILAIFRVICMHRHAVMQHF